MADLTVPPSNDVAAVQADRLIEALFLEEYDHARELHASIGAFLEEVADEQ